MDKAKKKRMKKYIAWVCLVALVALLAAMPLIARREAEADGPVASILEGTVQISDLETGLRGGGTLSAGNTETVELPKGVKIKSFLVKNGDIVAEGDPVATVDKVSVMTAIVQVRDTVEYLQEEMVKAKDDKVSSSVTAPAGGKIKAVYAKSGDSVQDVMLKHGALAVLSLDDMMAVKLELDTSMATGDSVKVKFSDGSVVTGRVESSLNGVTVITVDDKKYEIGAQVEVTAEDGTLLGVGQLYVHNAWNATAFTGTVSSVYAKANAKVGDGSTLFALKDTDYTGTLEALASLHREYEELLQDLFRMHETGVMTAPCAGEISGVDEDSEFLLSEIQGEEGWFVDLLSGKTQEEPGWTVMLLSSVEEEPCTKLEGCPAKKHEDGCPLKCTGLEGCTAPEGTHDATCAVFCTGLSDCANLNHKTGCLGVCTGSGDTCKSTRASQYHLKSCVKRCISDQDEDPATQCDSDVHYAACIEKCAKSEECTALTHKKGCWFHGVTYTAKAAMVSLAAIDGVQVIYGNTTYQVAPSGSGWKLVNPAQLQDLFVGGESQVLPGASGSEYQMGDILLLVTGTNSSNQTVLQQTWLYQRGQGGMAGFPGLPDFGDLSALMAGMTGMYGMYGGMAQGTGVELFDLERDVLMTVTEQDVMTLDISLDEKDIGKVSLGQTAQVKVTALKGKVFEAEVTEIGYFGTNNGGSSKFTVELTMPLAEDMISGMSATAYLPLNTKKSVLTVPVAALDEQGGRTVIYTALDPETGEPASPTEVTVGISDGVNAEVLSGLENGAVYYYSYYDTLELSTDVVEGKYSFKMG